MAILKQVVYEWHDEPRVYRESIVSIDEAWNGFDEEDESILFYFSTQQDFEDAKNKDNQFEFWIVDEL